MRGESPCAGCLDEASVTKPTASWPTSASYAASLRKVGRLPAANPRRGMRTSQRWRAAMVRASEGVIPPQPCEGHRNPLALDGAAIQRRASRRRSRRRGPLTRRACARLGDCPRPTLAGECGHHHVGVRRRSVTLSASSRRSHARGIAIPLRRLAAPSSAGQADDVLDGEGPLRGEPAQGWAIARGQPLQGNVDITTLACSDGAGL